MSTILANQILAKLSSQQRSGLFLIYSYHNKTIALKEIAEQTGFPYLNIGFELSKILLDVPVSRRPSEVRCKLSKLVSDSGSQTVLLHNVEILFETSLKNDPIDLFANLARRCRVVVAWPGEFAGGKLIYA